MCSIIKLINWKVPLQCTAFGWDKLRWQKPKTGKTPSISNPAPPPWVALLPCGLPQVPPPRRGHTLRFVHLLLLPDPRQLWLYHRRHGSQARWSRGARLPLLTKRYAHPRGPHAPCHWVPPPMLTARADTMFAHAMCSCHAANVTPFSVASASRTRHQVEAAPSAMPLVRCGRNLQQGERRWERMRRQGKERWAWHGAPHVRSM